MMAWSEKCLLVSGIVERTVGIVEWHTNCDLCTLARFAGDSNIPAEMFDALPNTTQAEFGSAKQPSLTYWKCSASSVSNHTWQAMPGKLVMNPCSLSGDWLAGRSRKLFLGIRLES
ncbi:MAG: hypothetical protein A3K04_09220 [Gallionellales bacterium RBG_16_56_9]|nr:MAG: hypothetical protein A3K04_09220 [Gallionellales bacterium RBG_16_56_9]